VNTPLEVFAWLAALEAPDAPPERRRALANAYSLAELAARDGHVSSDEQGFGRLVRLLAQMQADGWITWQWRRVAGDPRPEPPPAPLFSPLDAQSADDVRITPAGYTAYAARAQTTASPAGKPASLTADRSDDYRDVFLSHAGEDKDATARPLFDALTALGYSVWFDEAELVLGDSLTEQINRGLARSRFGVVILSEPFLAKKWPQRELNAMVARETSGGDKMILPVLHGIDLSRVVDAAPILADLVHVDSGEGIPVVADRIARAIERRRARERVTGEDGFVP
jgi:TIR domain